jgi:O-methyltransferase
MDQYGVEGDVAICGVWRGGLAILSCLISPKRRIWLYDTYNGMAGRSKFDRTAAGYQMPEGKAACSAHQVAVNVADAAGSFHLASLLFIEGKVEDTLLIETNLPDKIAALYLDTDWYYSTKVELERLWPRLQRRGAMIVDDYGHWRGSKKAVDEFFPPLERNLIVIDKTAVMMIKP